MLFQQTPPADDAGKTTKDSFKLGETLAGAVDVLGVFNSNILISKTSLESVLSTFEKMEDQVGRLATTFGGTRDLSQSIKEAIAGAIPSVTELGGGIQNVLDIQKGVVSALDTQVILSKDAYAELFAVGELVSDGTKTSSQTAEEMTRKFVDAGYGLYNIGGEMTKVLNTAREVGVSASATYTQLSKSIDKLALYNFENGVEGMAKMAAQAAGLRIDMSKTLDFADNLFNPDKAIEAAASFQRLGVQVQSLLDPYKLMDMARNDPAKLQESIIEATKSLVYFDEKNQKMAILPGAQGQMRELGAIMGYNAKEMAQMALNAGDLDRKLKEIRFPTDFANDKDRQMLANMAQLSGGTYVVTFDETVKDEQGNEMTRSVTKAVSDLSEANRRDLEKMNEPAKSAIDLQKIANGHLRNMDNALKARKGVVPQQIAASNAIDRTLKVAEEKQSKVVESFNKPLGLERNEQGVLTNDALRENVRQYESVLTSNLKSIFEGTKTSEQGFADIAKEFKTGMGETLQKLIEAPKEFLTPEQYDRMMNQIGTLTTATGINTQTNQQQNNPTFTTPAPLTPPTRLTPGTSLSLPGTQQPTSVPPNTAAQQQTPTNSELTVNINVNPKDLQNSVLDALRTSNVSDKIADMVAKAEKDRNTMRGGSRPSVAVRAGR